MDKVRRCVITSYSIHYTKLYEPAPYLSDTQYWEVIGGNGTFVDPTTNFVVNVTNLEPGNNIFRWAIAKGACPEKEDFIIITNNEVTAVAGSDQAICGNSATLGATDPSVIYPKQGTGA